jgi:hypothetical protein
MQNHQLTASEIETFRSLINASYDFLKSVQSDDVLKTEEYKELARTVNDAMQAMAEINTRSQYPVVP